MHHISPVFMGLVTLAWLRTCFRICFPHGTPDQLVTPRAVDVAAGCLYLWYWNLLSTSATPRHVLFSDSQSVTAWTNLLRDKAFGPRESVHAAQICCIALGCISWFYSVFLDQCLTYSSTSSFSFISIYHALNAMGESLSPLLIEADDR